MTRRGWCRTALSPSHLPGLDYSLNPYKGCAHNCVYCYAPPLLHMDRNRWPDVEARINIPQVLRREVKVKKPGIVGLSTVTDPYQPAEKKFELTRKCLPLLLKRDFSANVQTKSDLVLRDRDLLGSSDRVAVGITITTLDEDLSNALEPGAPPPHRRLQAVKALAEAGIYTYVFWGPLLPSLDEESLPAYVEAFASHGAREIMVDMLHVKPGVTAGLSAVLPPDRAALFEQRLRGDYYPRILEAVERACRGRIPLTRAFADRGGP